MSGAGLKARRAKTIDTLLHDVQSDDAKARSAAICASFENLKGRNSTSPRPDLVESLQTLFDRSPIPDVRSLCVAALTEMAEADQPPPALFQSLSDGDPSVVLQGTWALHYFPNSLAVEPLCRFIESRKRLWALPHSRHARPLSRPHGRRHFPD
ncbi:hypothetical protein BH10PLA1_BH10PLA1_12680 [soil metagenome]